MRIRLGVWVPGAAVDFETAYAPSIVQAGNLPWLLENGFDVACTIYASSSIASEVRDAARRSFASLPGNVELRVESLNAGPKSDPRAEVFLRECRAGDAEGAAVLLAGGGTFFGNGTLRNLGTYCRKPGIATFGTYLRAGRGPFLELMARYRKACGSAPLSNANLVDVGLGSPQDEPLRRLTDDLYALSTRRLVPLMFWPNTSDADFLSDNAAIAFDSLLLLWQLKLVAERRFRLMASTDLAFVLAVEGSDRAATTWGDADLSLPNAPLQHTCFITVRREALLGAGAPLVAEAAVG